MEYGRLSDIEPRLEAALRSIFFPLARVLVRNGLSVRPVIRVIKDAFVDAAVSEHGKNGRPASISRASELIGLTRKEIRTIINEEFDKKIRLSLFHADEAALLARWNSSPNFADDRGQPEKLKPGPGPDTFADLVKQSMGDVSVSDTLRRLEERECVAVDDEGRISMLKRDWNVASDLPILLRDTLGTLSSTVDFNDTHIPEDGRCQRVAYTISANPENLLVIRRMLRSRIVRFTEEVDDQLTSFEISIDELDTNSAVAETGKLGVATYYFEIDSPD